MSRAVPRYRRINPSLPPPGLSAVVEVIVKGVVEGQQTINTFYYIGAPGGSLTVSNLQQAATAWQAAFLASYRACLSADWSLVSVSVACLTQPSLLTVTDTTNAALTGSGAAGHEPTTVAVVISRTTSTKGQHGRGRIYLPAVVPGNVLLSSLTLAAAAGVYGTFTTSLFTGMTFNAIAYASALVQRTATPPRSLFGAQALATTTLHGLLGTIRRRRVGRGK